MLTMGSPSPPFAVGLTLNRTLNKTISTTNPTLPSGFSLHRNLQAKRDGLMKAFSTLDFSGESDAELELESPLFAAQRFYECINSKDMGVLRRSLAKDCLLEDSSFHKPFQGLQDVEEFLRDLMVAMGDNVKFATEGSLEGTGLTSAIVWHLEWKGKSVPFTRGCTFFECEKIKENLSIKKIRVVVESPLKPGRSVLEMLKLTTAVFDRYPQLANGLLQEPYVIIQYLMRIYKMFLEPLVLPLVVYYVHLWALASRILKRVFDLLLKLFGISF